MHRQNETELELDNEIKIQDIKVRMATIENRITKSQHNSPETRLANKFFAELSERLNIMDKGLNVTGRKCDVLMSLMENLAEAIEPKQFNIKDLFARIRDWREKNPEKNAILNINSQKKGLTGIYNSIFSPQTEISKILDKYQNIGGVVKQPPKPK